MHQHTRPATSSDDPRDLGGEFHHQLDIQVRFADTAVASPAEMTRHEATGAQSLPLLFESGRRVTWQRLHQALTGDGHLGHSLDQLAEAMDTATRAFSHDKIRHAAAGNRLMPH